jgi:predicted small lipoprotein YifL
MRIMPAVLLLAALSGCGLKGDLYLPQPKEPAAAAAPPEEEDPAATGVRRAPSPP